MAQRGERLAGILLRALRAGRFIPLAAAEAAAVVAAAAVIAIAIALPDRHLVAPLALRA